MADEKPDEQAGEPSAQERPDWLPENFQSPEDLARSYSEAQRKISEQGQQLSQVRDELDSMAELVAQQQAPAPQEYRPADNPLVLAYEQAMEQGDYRAGLEYQARIMAEIAQQTIAGQQQPAQPAGSADSMLAVYGDMAERTLRTTYGDEMFKELIGPAAELLKTGRVQLTDPSSLDGVQSAMDTAFRFAAADRLFNQQKEAAASEQQAEADRQRKLAAQTVQGQGNRPPPQDQQQQVWDELLAAGSSRFRTS